MSRGLFDKTPLQQGMSDLRDDLIQEGGPQISTMRNYRFAILQYDPQQEFELRSELAKLSTGLSQNGWVVLSIDLQKLMLARLQRQQDDFINYMISVEKMLSGPPENNGLNHLCEKISLLIEGPNGIAGDCIQIIQRHADENPELVNRTVALVARAGSLYPFYRSSALLRHLDGQTRNVPVILFYPGERRGLTGLSFMGQLDPDNDYRPRIYPETKQ
jgi:hypothetical protein